MNYLAHAYLSFDRPGLLVGNMISDFVKGRKKYDYPEEILFGINLHRSIDDFTDTHYQTKQAKKIFEDSYGLYSGAFMDVSYDYFIANDAGLFGKSTLEEFSLGVYNTLESYSEWFPAGFAGMFPYMKKHNWLLNYRHESGIRRSFEGLVHRAAYMDDSTEAFRLFSAHTRELGEAYRIFFPELVAFTREIINRNNR
ncbi:MAG: DUF479 domain-containing protein [Sphingobacteriales bacterium]|nr:MAG: DUF479 domain-containing protein [Sphingobacteriales bacterium]